MTALSANDSVTSHIPFFSFRGFASTVIPTPLTPFTPLSHDDPFKLRGQLGEEKETKKREEGTVGVRFCLLFFSTKIFGFFLPLFVE